MNHPQCSHQDAIDPKVVPTTTNGCEDCLKTGDTWIDLRLCLTCGHVGCCNSSKNKHAQKHFEETKHPIIEAFGEEDAWRWCYIDKVYL